MYIPNPESVFAEPDCPMRNLIASIGSGRSIGN